MQSWFYSKDCLVGLVDDCGGGAPNKIALLLPLSSPARGRSTPTGAFVSCALVSLVWRGFNSRNLISASKLIKMMVWPSSALDTEWISVLSSEEAWTSAAFFHGHKRSTNSCGAPSGTAGSSLDSIDLLDSGSGGNKSLFSPSIGLFLLRELIRILRRSRGIVTTSWELCCRSMTRSTKADAERL